MLKVASCILNTGVGLFSALASLALFNTVVKAGVFGDWLAPHALAFSVIVYGLLLALCIPVLVAARRSGWQAIWTGSSFLALELARFCLATLMALEGAALLVIVVWWDKSPIGAGPAGGVSGPLHFQDWIDPAHWLAAFYLFAMVAFAGFYRMLGWLGDVMADPQASAVPPTTTI